MPQEDECVADQQDGALQSELFLTATWNIAAVNNNPLEYWTTYDAPAYKQLMDDMEAFVEAPAERDVPLEQVFPAAMFDELIGLMSGLEWEGVDEVVALWNSDLKSRLIVSGFMKDKEIGSKRFISMPDRFTNTINTATATVCRPAVINNFVGDLTDSQSWWAQWKAFMFEAPLAVQIKNETVEQIPCQMLSKISRSKYPALSEEEERISLPLQTLCLALFDATMVHMMNTLSPDGEWLTIKRRCSDLLIVKKQDRTLEILQTERYSACDVVFLQEVAGNFVGVLGASSLADSHHIVAPKKLDSKRDQNSLLLLKKSSFPDAASITEINPQVREALPAGTGEMDGDIIAVTATDASGTQFLLVSFHGDTNGIQSIPVLQTVQSVAAASYPNATLVFGLDANVHEKEQKNTQHYAEWVAAYNALGLTSIWGAEVDPIAARTTYNARTYVQPQLQKAVKSTEFEKGDCNPKDYIVFAPEKFEVTETPTRDNSGNCSEFVETPIPSLVWPSDHVAVLAKLKRKRND